MVIRARLLVLTLILAITAACRPVQADPPVESKPAAETGGKIKTVAVLLFEGVELLDFAGPAEVFIVADRGHAFRVITVAASTQPVKTMGGVTITPDFRYQDAPRAEVVVVPGGNLQAVGKPGRDWVKQAAREAEIVMSVCYGALLLGDIGLLDGLSATTHHWAIEDLKRTAPKCRVIEGKRFVDSGKIITTAGVTAGIDGAPAVPQRGRDDYAARRGQPRAAGRIRAGW